MAVTADEREGKQVIFEEIDGTTHIWFRQSWLDTAFRCPERGRLAIVKPEWDSMTSDSALLGTSVHHAIETFIDGSCELDDMADVAVAYLEEYTEPIKWTKYDTISSMTDHVNNCVLGWQRDILPHLPNLDGALTEATFKIPLWSQHGYTVGITGTIDLVANGELWDWKTSGKPYRPSEKQKYAIQGTIYALAALHSDLVTAPTLPMRFTYGVMIRGSKPAGQILSVTRTQGHIDFATTRMKQFVDLAHHYGIDKAWPANDDHFLCSSTWCPWWSICKGAHLTAADDRVGD